MARKPISLTPPSPSLVAVPGQGCGLGLPHLPCGEGGGGPTPTYMAQNDPHGALIILTTHMWGNIFSLKNLFRAKICVPAPLAATSVLTQNKGPGTEAHFRNAPPPPSPGAHAIPPPPPAKQFSGRPGCTDEWGGT